MPTPLPAAAFLKKPDSLPQAPVYAVFGPEAWLRRRCLKELSALLESRGLAVRRGAVGDSIARTLDELRSPPMFDGPFALILSNERQGPRHEDTTRFKDEFLAYLERPGKRNVLVFDGATWQRNLSVPKRVCADYPSVICEELKPWDAAGWDALVRQQASEQGLKLDAHALTALREYSGGSLARAENELAKLALLSRDGRVSADDIAHACGYDGADLTFPLCDAVLTGDSRTALHHAAALAAKAEVGSLLSLLALLRLQVNALGRAAIALRSGASGPDAISRARARLRENHKAGFLRVARGLDRARVLAATDVLLRADEDMKSSSPDPAILTVAVVAGLCETLHPR